MSEELSTGDWAHEDDMAFWREQVAEFARSREAAGVVKHRSLEGINPELAAKALYLLQKGATIYRASKETGISEIVIRRTASHHLGSLEKWRPDLVQRLGSLSMVSMEALAMKYDQIMSDPEEMKKVSIDKLAVTAGIVTDKFMSIQGMATSVVEHRSGPSVEEYQAMIESARKRLAETTPAIEAEIISEDNQVATA